MTLKTPNPKQLILPYNLYHFHNGQRRQINFSQFLCLLSKQLSNCYEFLRNLPQKEKGDKNLILYFSIPQGSVNECQK